MKFKDIKDVLTFAAFRPEPDDSSFPWVRRFPNKRTILLNVGKNRTSWQILGKGKRLAETGNQKGDFKEIASAFAPEWRKQTDNGWCNVSINSRYIISLENNLPRKEGIEDIMRSNPRAILGSKHERNKRYALTSNPEHTTSIVLSSDDETVKKVEATLSENNLHAGRICCGTYAMLRRLIEHANPGAQVPDSRPVNYLYVVCCEGSVCTLVQSGDVWSDLRSRTDIYEEDTTPVVDMIAPSFREGDPQDVEILFVSDQQGSDIPEKLGDKFGHSRITDLTQSNHLMATIAELH